MFVSFLPHTLIMLLWPVRTLYKIPISSVTIAVLIHSSCFRVILSGGILLCLAVRRLDHLGHAMAKEVPQGSGAV